eukprot:scaffold110950_cov29-Tisochrysis_lutea.AAC.3
MSHCKHGLVQICVHTGRGYNNNSKKKVQSSAQESRKERGHRSLDPYLSSFGDSQAQNPLH